MNAIIIEDEQLTADRLHSLISKHTSIEVLETFYSVKSAVSWLQDHSIPDILFLDIQLGDGTGFDVLESLDAYPQVIFTTAFDKYVLDAFKYNSVDYLLKPVKAEELMKAVGKLEKMKSQNEMNALMQSLQSQIQTSYKQKFLVKIGLKYQSISIQDVAYFYSESSSTYLRTSKGDSLIIDQPLDEIQTLIDPACFFRINRHMIICDQFIESIDSFFNNRLLIGLKPKYDQQVIVSRDKVKVFKEWLDR
ncbi:LytR/AlgR family response regulator transcription factor [Ekhidna sp.]